MIKANIKRGEKAEIQAKGSIPELLGDLAELVNGIHSQFKAVSPTAANLFRAGFESMVNDPQCPMWTPMDGQMGVIFPSLGEE